MSDPQAEQLDVVQHPTLGELKFPHSMSPEERNASIERLEAQQPKTAPEPSFGNTLSREATAFGKSFTGIPGAIKHAFTDEPTSDEVAEFGDDFKGAKRIGLGIGRLTAEPITKAARWYKDAIQGNIDDPVGQALTVAPEAMGSGAAAAVGGKVAEYVPGIGKGIVKATPNIVRRVGDFAERNAPALGKTAGGGAAIAAGAETALRGSPQYAPVSAFGAYKTVTPTVTKGAQMLGRGLQRVGGRVVDAGDALKQSAIDGEYVNTPPVTPKPEPPFAPAEEINVSSEAQPAPYSRGIGEVPVDITGNPPANVLGGNKGIIIRPPRQLKAARLGAPMNAEAIDDMGVAQEVGDRVNNEGIRLRRDASREFADRNDPSVPKWRRLAEFRAQMAAENVMREAELAQQIPVKLGKTRTPPPTATPPLGKPQAGQFDDMVPVLEESIRQAKAKRLNKQ